MAFVHSSISTLIVLMAVQQFDLSPVQGFSVDFIHRDSPNSPYYNPTASHYERLRQSFLRSFSRAKHLKTQILRSNKQQGLGTLSSEGFQSSIVTSESGEYLIGAAIGTPSVDILAIADTGSDLTWTQCKPCVQCFKQVAQLFDPRQSSTYKKTSCDSQKCLDTGSSSCDAANNCQYKVSYGDRSYSIGDVATETFTFRSSTSGKKVSIPEVTFGCGHENVGTFDGMGSGIIGLGGGSSSIINQLENLVMGKFSYCLIPPPSTNISSKISFGTTAVVSGPQTVSTPLYKKIPDTFYYINIEGISVGSATLTPTPKQKKIDIASVKASPSDDGNIIMDSGTTLTFLPEEIYDHLESTLRERINATVIPDPEGMLNLCYMAVEGIRFPDLVVHFTGADVTLPGSNTFLHVSDDVICLTLVPDDDAIAIFGNLSQGNYHIAYDLVDGTVSFQPTDCSTPS